MRFHSLRIALLAGFLAATTPADSTGTKSKSATLREERSPPSDRDAIAAIEASADDEDRAGESIEKPLTAQQFVEWILLNFHGYHQKAVVNVSDKYNKMVAEGTIPLEVYDEMVGMTPLNELLPSTEWRTWAFLASKYSLQNGMDPHKYIVEAMWSRYGAGRFSEILAAAAENFTMENIVEKLREVQLSLWLKKKYNPHEVFILLQVADVWENNIFESPRFVTWTHYLKRVRKTKDTEDPVDVEVRGLLKFIKYGPMLRMPMLPENASHLKSRRYLEVLGLIGLDHKMYPDDVVSILLEGVTESETQFTLLFMHQPSKSFWMLYVKEFNKRYPLLETSLCKSLMLALGMPKLMTMLHAAVFAPDENRSGMALLYFEFQFSEWKTSQVEKITDIEPDLTIVPLEDWPVIEAIWFAYAKYHKKGTRPLKEDFIL